ncbi:MAG: hypothetical protein QXQ18_01300 [Candidatus Aenigmatarchaeota archaeon]
MELKIIVPGILIYDIPKNKDVLRVKVHRALEQIKAEKIQTSAWRSENLQELIKIALMIRNAGCEAIVLEEKRIL